LSTDLGGDSGVPVGEYDFIVRIADVSNLKVYYVTNNSKQYTIVATGYEEALTVAGFEAGETTKDDEGVY